MYSTTQVYKDNVYAQSRRFSGRVTFEITDVEASGAVSSVSTSTQASNISLATQLFDGVRSPSYSLATFEPGRFKLDGSMSFADSNVANNGQVGFVSDVICGADGTFSPAQTITINYSSLRSSYGITVTFDQNSGEYATEFSVRVYNGTSLVASQNVNGNTSVAAAVLQQPLSNYNKIEVIITKWVIGNRRARVLEIDAGTVKVYTDDNLINMELTEEMDAFTGQLPSPEFRFTIDNSSREFNILNPSGVYAFLQQRQRITAELGLDINGSVQWVPLGKYLLWEWKGDEGAMTATFTARTALDLMENYSYEQSTANSQSLYNLAVANFAACGITKYSIDTALQSIMTDSLSEKINRRELLQRIALAGLCNIWVSRDDAIHLKQLPNTVGAAVDRIDLDNAYKEPQVVLDTLIGSVQVSYWTSISSSATYTATDSSITNGSTLALTGNKLINTSARAQAVAEWLLGRSKLRAILQSNWRGNPVHELGDVLGIENVYGSDRASYVTKNQLTYTGYLKATTETRGASS